MEIHEKKSKFLISNYSPNLNMKIFDSLTDKNF